MKSQYSLAPSAPVEPGHLVIIGFPDEHSAFDLRDHLYVLEEEAILSIGDCVVATRDAQCRIRLHQSLPLMPVGVAAGSFGGMLLGMTLLNPIFGPVTGLALGVTAAALIDVGINDKFMKEIAETLQPRSSALFVVVRRTKPELLLERLKPFAGRCRILQSTLKAENESRLRALFEEQLETGTDSKDA